MEARQAVRRIRVLSVPLEPLPVGIEPRLPPLPGIRAVVFDVYGTLFVSASGEVGSGDPAGAGPGRARERAFAEAFAACGLRAAPGASARAAVLVAELIHTAHERDRARGIAYPEIDIRGILAGLIEALSADGLVHGGPPAARCAGLDLERLALEYECRANPTWPMPGCPAVLEALRDSGRSLGLVSNAQFYTPWLFAAHLGVEPSQLGIDEELCVWSYRLGQAKPSPALFAPVLRTLAERGIAAAEILYVGNDRRNDVGPAARLGCRTALFAGDRRSYRPREGDPQLGGVRPDALITHLEQLPPLLASPRGRPGTA